MNACNPVFNSNFDAGDCVAGIFGGILDALTGAIFGLPIWVLLVMAAVGLGIAYRQGGIPGLTAAAVGIGYLIGRQSMRVAHPDNPMQPTKRKLTADEVRKLQAALNGLGFNAGSVDGIPGRQTREAIQQFQVSREEIATGIPTAQQLKDLRVWK